MNNKSKHIVLLTPGFPANEKDSSAIPALQIYVKALKANNPDFDIKIITFQYPFVSKNYNWFGCKVYPLNGRNKKYKKFFIWQKAKDILNKIHTEKNITILHSFWLGECAFVGAKFSKKQNSKHVITAMGQDVNKNLFLNLFSNKFSKYGQIITLSKLHKKLLHKNYELKSTIIPWGINPKNFPKTKEKIITILGVGSLIEIKNFSLFIKIISKLKKQVKNLSVEIIGDGNYKDQLKQEVKDYKLQDIISFKGQLPRTKVLDKMAKSKILLHTSSYESFGMVFLEALQTNMKIVSFNVGFAENSENWLVCKTENEMLENLKLLLQNFKVTNCKTTFTINQTVTKYCKIYNE